MSMEGRLEVGQVYIATPALIGQRQRLAIVIGRMGRTVQLAFVNELATAKAYPFGDDREYAKAETEFGCYTISSKVTASADEAAYMHGILKREREEGGKHVKNTK